MRPLLFLLIVVCTCARLSAQIITTWGFDPNGPYTAPEGLTDVIAASTGDWHTLALKADGTVVAWGENDLGQCTVPPGLNGVIAVSTGGGHSLALKNDGTVVAWGFNTYHQCDVPAGLSGVVAITAGGNHSLALRSDGTVVSWGDDTGSLPPQGLGEVVAISARDGSIAVKSTGSVVSWGSFSEAMNVPAGLTDVAAVSVGGNHSLAVKFSGAVAAWGSNAYGQTTVPAGLSNVIAVAAGQDSSLALTSDGLVTSWGYTGSPTVQLPPNLHDVFALSTAQWRALALARAPAGPPIITGPFRALTTAGFGYLRYRISTLAPAASYTASGLPAGLTLNASTGVISGTATQAGQFSVTLGATGAGGTASATLVVHVIGAPVYLGTTLPPVIMAGLPLTAAVFASGRASFTATGLPPGVTLNSSTGGLSGTPVAPGTYQINFRFSNSYGFVDKTITCEVSPVAAWGQNDFGQATVPPGLSDTIAVEGGRAHSLALKRDGSVAAWGDNTHGQCNVPAGLTNVVAVTAGEDHSLAVKADGTVVAWGRNHAGQCDVPLGLSNVVAVAAGASHSLALGSDGVAVVWGSNSAGQKNIPAGLHGVTAIAAGGDVCFALKSNGSVVTWGTGGLTNPFVLPSGVSGTVNLTGSSYTCGLLQPDGTAYFSNSQGLATLHNDGPWLAAATGDYESLLLRANRTVKAHRYPGVPSQLNLSSVAAVGVGGPHYLAVIGPSGRTPHIISPLRAVTTGGYGSFYYRILTLSPATGFTAGGLPAGLSLDGGTGIITGTPTEAGEFSVQLGASGAGGNATAVLKLFVTGVPALLTSTLDAVWMPAVPPGGALLASNAAVITATGMPPGTGIDPALGTVTGAPAQPGIYNVTFRFTNAFGFTEQTRAVEVSAVTAWGRDDNGLNTVPPGLSSGVRALAAGEAHWLALKMDGSVVSWGRLNSVPSSVSNAVAIAAGSYHSLALRQDGTVVAWGENSSGQINVPAGLTDVVAIAAGSFDSAALRKDGTVVSWGSVGSAPATLSGVVDVTAGTGYVQALKSDGMRSSWKAFTGNSPGDGTAAGPAVRIEGGVSHAVGIRADGTALAWSLTSGAWTNVPAGLTNVVDVSAGDQCSMALKADGTLAIWGYDQFNNGHTVVPSGLPAAAAIGAGQRFSIALARPSAGPPVIVSPVRAVATGGYGDFYYRIRTLRPASSFAVSGLPAGLALEAGGVIRGRPTVAGEFAVALEASSAGGVSTANLRLFVTGGPQLLVSTVPSILMGGMVPNGRVTASNSPVYTAEGLPPGVSIDPATGLLSGVPRTPGVYPVVFRYTNSLGSATHAMTIEVSPVAAWGRNSSGQCTPPPGLSGVKALGAAYYTSLALKTDGTVVAWGLDPAGGAGAVPPGLANVTSLTAGRGGHVLALQHDGTVVAWGNNGSGQSTVPPDIGPVMAVAAGDYFSLALRSDGTVMGWGSHANGETSPPPGTTGIVAIAAGNNHALALRSDGTVVAWGLNDNGQATVPPGLTGVIAIAASSNSSLALKADGTLTGWGLTSPSAGLTGVKAITAGGSHYLALKTDGSVVAWGSNSSSQVSGAAGLTGMAAVEGGDEHSLALLEGGSGPPEILNASRALATAGYGVFRYQIHTLRPATGYAATGLPAGLSINETTGLISGTPSVTGTFSVNLTASSADGTAAAPLSLTVIGVPFYAGATLPRVWTLGLNPPGQVFSSGAPVITAEGLPPGTQVHPATGAVMGAPQRAGSFEAAFHFNNAFGTAQQRLTFDVGSVAAWGFNASGQINLPPASSDAVNLAGGNDHSVALKRDGTVIAWGSNADGRSTVPVGLSGVIAIAAGLEHSLALRSDGTVVAWGRNQSGQTTVPAGLTGVTAIVAGEQHSTVLRSDGKVTVWGSNSSNQRTVPSTLTNVTAVACGRNHNLSLKSDGTIVAWGDNSGGQTTIPAGLAGVAAIAAGGRHSVALKNDGTVVAWGSNTYGQTTVPAGLSGVTAIAAGYYYSMARRSDGSVAVWGRNDFGQTAVPAGLARVAAMGAGSHHVFALIGPALDSSAAVTALQGAPFEFQVSATWAGGVFAATGLPPALSIAPGSGLVSGVPQSTGVFPVTFSATFTGGGRTFNAVQNATVTVAPFSYANWRNIYFPGNIAAGAPAADGDGDGLPNLVEFSAGSSPVLSNAISPVVPGTGPDGHLQVRAELVSAAAAFLTVRAEFADDLNFTAGLTEVTAAVVTDSAPGKQYRTFTDPREPGGALHRFGRLRLVLQE